MDTIPTNALKDGREVLARPITYIINKILETGIYPNKWKIALVIPLYKGKGDRSDPKNYRPISLISNISKICEGIISEQLVNHMTINHMWSWDQHAYRCGLSIATALLTLQEWLKRMENKLQSLLVSLDMSSAFDTICHEVLLSKL